MNRELLRAEMNKRGMNQTQLAELTNIAPSIISRILSGERDCNVATAAKIVNAMKLKPAVATEIFFNE